MLWALLLTPFEVFLHRGAVTGSKILGVISVLATLVSGSLLVRHLLRFSRSGQPAYVLFSFLVAGASPFVVWATYGMENGLVALLMVLCVLLFLIDMQQGSVGSALLVFLLETVRPEGFLYVGVFIVMWVLLGILPDHRMNRKTWFKWLIVLTICMALYEIAGFAYYGHLLPNTVYAKVDGLSAARLWRGIQYLKEGPCRFYSILLLVALQLVAFRIWLLLSCHGKSLVTILREEVGVLLISALLVVHWVFVIFVGGDWMTNARFLSHTIPLLLVLFVVVACQVADLLLPTARPRKLTAVICLSILNLLAAYWVMNFRFGRSSYAWQENLQTAEERALTGMVQLVNERCENDDAVLACSDIGRAGYMFRGRVLDWWGLADEEIARLGQAYGRPLDPAVVLRRRPDFIVLYSNEPVLTQDSMRSGMARYSEAFYQSPGFLSDYDQVGSLLFWHDRWHVLFQRKPDNVSPYFVSRPNKPNKLSKPKKADQPNQPD